MKKCEKCSCKTEALGHFDTVLAQLDKVLYITDDSENMYIHKDILKTLAWGKPSDSQIKALENYCNEVKKLELSAKGFVTFINPKAIEMNILRVQVRNLERAAIKARYPKYTLDYLNAMSKDVFESACNLNEQD
jgi:cob(I)alamin adenosyltransferase